MEKHLLKNVPEKERIETLESSADKVENFSYTKPFTPDQSAGIRGNRYVRLLVTLLKMNSRLLKTNTNY
jgi:hypothetical protein